MFNQTKHVIFRLKVTVGTLLATHDWSATKAVLHKDGLKTGDVVDIPALTSFICAKEEL